MKQVTVSILLMVFISECLSQRGFSQQFQAVLNISGIGSWDSPLPGVKQLLYDSVNLRVRFDVKGSTMQQNETWMLQYKPKGAEANTPASQGYTMFNFNPDFPMFTKNNCWYRTNSMIDIGPFPIGWLKGIENYIQIYPWYPLPSNLINRGEEWLPELHLNATRYDSPQICNLVHSRMGKVPCFSYFETEDRPVKTIQARPVPPESFDNDEYITTVYLSYKNGIPSQAEHLFNLPAEWPGYCGNANAAFTVNPANNFVITPNAQDQFTLKLETPPIQSLGGQVNVAFKIQPSGIYNGTRCGSFNPIVFNQENWQTPQQVNVSFVDYGCCIYGITANNGGYDWQYTGASIFVFACHERAGDDCKEKKCVL